MKWKSACKQLEKQIKPKDGIYIAVEYPDGWYIDDDGPMTEQEVDELHARDLVIKCEHDGFGAL